MRLYDGEAWFGDIRHVIKSKFWQNRRDRPAIVVLREREDFRFLCCGAGNREREKACLVA